jgi:hypothetical protein
LYEAVASTVTVAAVSVEAQKTGEQNNVAKPAFRLNPSATLKLRQSYYRQDSNGGGMTVSAG